MGVTVSSSHVVSAAPSSSGGGLLTLCPCSSMGSLPWETVLHELLQREPFPRAAALHELLQHGCPTGSQALPANLLQCELLSPQVHRSCQEPAPARAPHRVTASFRHPPAPAWGPFHGLQVEICSTMDLHGLQGSNLPHHGLRHGLQGNLCSSAWSTGSSPSSLTLVSAELFLSHRLTPLSQLQLLCCAITFLRRCHRP